jgi:hypothetical protein
MNWTKLSARGHRIITATGTLLGTIALLPVAVDTSGGEVNLPIPLWVLAWCAFAGLVTPFLATWWRAVTGPADAP